MVIIMMERGKEERGEVGECSGNGNQDSWEIQRTPKYKGMDESNYLVLYAYHSLVQSCYKFNLSSQQPYKEDDIILSSNMKNLVSLPNNLPCNSCHCSGLYIHKEKQQPQIQVPRCKLFTFKLKSDCCFDIDHLPSLYVFLLFQSVTPEWNELEFFPE